MTPKLTKKHHGPHARGKASPVLCALPHPASPSHRLSTISPPAPPPVSPPISPPVSPPCTSLSTRLSTVSPHGTQSRRHLLHPYLHSSLGQSLHPSLHASLVSPPDRCSVPSCQKQRSGRLASWARGTTSANRSVRAEQPTRRARSLATTDSCGMRARHAAFIGWPAGSRAGWFGLVWFGLVWFGGVLRKSGW